MAKPQNYFGLMIDYYRSCNENFLFKTLDKQNVDQSLFYDTLKLIFISMKAQFPISGGEIEV